MDNLSWVVMELERLGEAESLCKQAIEGRRKTLGDHHPDTLRSNGTLSAILRGKEGRENVEEAARILEAKLAQERKGIGEEHHDTIETMGNLACTLYILGKLDEAERLQREVIYRSRRKNDPDRPSRH